MHIARLAAFLGSLLISPMLFASLSWHDCPDSYGDSTYLSCATLDVPLDYGDPQKKIGLELAKYDDSPSSVKKPVLLINAGGPWVDTNGSLVDFAGVLDKRLREKYTLLSFNPRGSGDTALTCETPLNQQLQSRDLSQTSERDTFLQLSAKQQNVCQRQLPALAAHVDLDSVVKDVEAIRNAIAVRQISLLMYSYGARLAAYYMQAYPQNVSRVILDSPVYFSDDYIPLIVGQAQAYEKTLHRFFSLCKASPQCVIHKDPKKYYQRALGLASDGIPCGGDYNGRRFTRAMFLKVIEKILPSIDYDKEDNPVSSWAYLADAIYEINHDFDASMMMQAYINLTGYDVKSGELTRASNQVENSALCLDYPYRPSVNSILPRLSSVAKSDPTIGLSVATINSANCLSYREKYKAMPAVDLSHNQVPVLLISSAFDPQAPRAWAMKDHQDIAHSSMLLWQGVGHGVFNDNAVQNTCVNNAVVAFLSAKTQTSKQRVCPMEVSLFR